MYPDVHGFPVRGMMPSRFQKGIHTPILLLTAKSTTEDKIVGLDSGADDYLAKPFQVDELLARLRALTRRKADYSDSKELTYGDLSLNLSSLELKCKNKSVVLMNKEMQIMTMLMKNAPNVVSLDSIAKGAWDIEAYSTSENVWTFISYLRKKMESIGSKVKIKSIRYQGYYLEK